MSNSPSITIPFEEEYQGFEIYVEENPDHYNEGYSWSVSKNDECIDEGIEFDIKMAIDAARDTIANLNSKTK
ncbi:hypothetical protein [Shewanella phaeophyticola]|uniref:Phage protein n=1 Tax=Shewanella phaeophyticola TaxID=2978345 RepID=A0ABT2NY10_9GAMM|nr:hypothetical protein [Shewanella sp. KJ10-1]MCT8985290.1 hypothetical protein [Shewanella sp. KJ10-1]